MSVGTYLTNATLMTAYAPNNDLSVLTCTEQHQICNPSPRSNATANCMPMLALDQLSDDEYNNGLILQSVLDNDY